MSQDEKRLDFLHYLEKAESEVYSKQHSYKTTKAGLSLGHLTYVELKKNVVEFALFNSGKNFTLWRLQLGAPFQTTLSAPLAPSPLKLPSLNSALSAPSGGPSPGNALRKPFLGTPEDHAYHAYRLCRRLRSHICHVIPPVSS